MTKITHGSSGGIVLGAVNAGLVSAPIRRVLSRDAMI